ncbi:MAG: hypothetical protein ACJ72N_07460 [Labedaea sp.]
MLTTRRQTAGNNPFLGRVKRIFNVPIFKRVSELVNAGDEAGARGFLATFHADPSNEGLDAFIAEHFDR